MYNHAQFDAQQ